MKFLVVRKKNSKSHTFAKTSKPHTIRNNKRRTKCPVDPRTKRRRDKRGVTKDYDSSDAIGRIIRSTICRKFKFKMNFAPLCSLFTPNNLIPLHLYILKFKRVHLNFGNYFCKHFEILRIYKKKWNRRQKRRVPQRQRKRKRHVRLYCHSCRLDPGQSRFRCPYPGV